MQRVVTELVDDIDGSTAAETVRFSIDGVAYEIDLSKQNASNLRKGLDEFVSHGRRTGGRAKRAAAKGRRGADKTDTGAIRDWAQAQGLKVSGRGRISADVAQAYRDAHKV